MTADNSDVTPAPVAAMAAALAGIAALRGLPVFAAALFMASWYFLAPDAAARWRWRQWLPGAAGLGGLLYTGGGALGALAVALGLLLSVAPAGTFGRKIGAAWPSRREWLLLPAVWAAMLGAGVLLTGFWYGLLRGFGVEFTTRQEAMELFLSSPLPDRIAIVVLAAVIAPVSEEIIFRYFLFHGLRQTGERTALWGTAAVFAACHGFLFGIPYLLVVGLGLQWIYRRTGRLSMAMLLHGLVNGAALATAWFWYGRG